MHASLSSAWSRSELLAAVLGVFLIILAGCRETAVATATFVTAPAEVGSQRLEFIAPRMGMAARIVLYAADPVQAQHAADAALAEIARLDRILSDYRADSEVAQVNAAAGKAAVAVSPELIEVLTQASLVSQVSDGGFDVSIGPVSQLWREATPLKRVPSRAEVQAAHALVNWREIEFDASARSVRLRRLGMRLDFGGIGKGYAADRALRILQQHGIPSAIVSLAGDIAIGAAPPGKRGWSIAIDDGLSGEPCRFELADCCISTSGDAEQSLLLDGERRSHIIDPEAGLGLDRRITATVIAPRGAEADALATAVSVLGHERGLTMIQQTQHAHARIVFHDAAGTTRILHTHGFARPRARPRAVRRTGRVQTHGPIRG